MRSACNLWFGRSPPAWGFEMPLQPYPFRFALAGSAAWSASGLPARWRAGKQVAASLLIALVWSLGIAAGCFALWNHAGTPGTQQAAAPRWPTKTALQRSGNCHSLVVFAHPHCPCTRATLRELERLVAQWPAKLDTQVVFVQPPKTSPDWAHTGSWQLASAIPGVNVVFDRMGMETRRFGASTSGEALLYDNQGRLVFQGGITPARGHEGDNAGRIAISHWLAGQGDLHQAPVFGCPLLGPSASESSE
jgi:hypothetical protein